MMMGKGILRRLGISTAAAIALSVSPAEAQSLTAALGTLLRSVNSPAAVSVAPGSMTVCFSPQLPGSCDPQATVIGEIDRAQKSILVQIYTITSREIVAALLSAKQRGIEVRLIIDRRQFEEDRSEREAVAQLVASGIPVMVDGVPGLAHSKVAIIDSRTVITGSFNFTWSASHRNAENLIVVNSPTLAAQYQRAWDAAAARARPLAEETD
jgi:phosphatidylserine/phosphatidylglycerophosphate/cardiolipin synthase-like enzyme